MVKTAKPFPRWVWAIPVVVAILGGSALVWALGDPIVRPKDQIVRPIDCDLFDFGDGSVTLACTDGLLWSCIPTTLGPEAQTP